MYMYGGKWQMTYHIIYKRQRVNMGNSLVLASSRLYNQKRKNL